MSNSENGKDEKAKNGEIDRLLKVIDAIARIDTKLDAFDVKYKGDVDGIKDEISDLEKRLLSVETEGAKPIQELLRDLKGRVNRLYDQAISLEQRRSDLVQEVEKNGTAIVKLREQFDRWKIYWSVVAFIVSPTVTTLIVLAIHHFLGLPV